VAFDKSRTKQYQSTASLLFLAQGVNTSSSGGSTSVSAQQLATDVELVQSAPVRTTATKFLGMSAPPVSVAIVGTTQVADLTVQSTDPAFAARAANAYATAYINLTREQFVNSQLASEKAVQKQINSLQFQIDTVQLTLSSTSNSAASQSGLQADLTGLYQQQSALKTQLAQLQLTTAQSSSGGQLVSRATASGVPSSPKIGRDIGIAVVAGLLVGMGFALLRETLADRIRSKDELEKILPEIPVLGLIPVIDDWRDREKPYLVAKTHPRASPSEAYRGLRTSVQFMALDNPIRFLQFTSPSAGDGKTTTSANVAWIMAQAGQRVVLVSCDLRRPRIHEFFGLPNEIGLTSVLLGEAELEDALLPVEDQPRLQLLPSGPVPPNPSELLSSRAIRRVFKELSDYADIVVVDSAPILPVTDPAVLSTSADAVILVVSAGTDRRRDVVRSVEMFRQINAPLVGVVLNRAPQTDVYAYYRYGYGYEEKTSDKPARIDGTMQEVATANDSRNSNGDSKIYVDAMGKVEWPSLGRHAKPEPSTTALSPAEPAQSGDTPSE
jgi:capsular exopolysaccharide synthesis family protein